MTLTAVLVSLGEAKNLCPFMFTPMRSQTRPLIPVNSPAISLRETSAGLNPSLLYVDVPLIFAAILIIFSPQFWLQLFPLDIPANATYVGDKTINGTACSVWTWNPYESYYIDVCIPLPRLISTQPCTDVGEQEDHPLR